MKDWESESYGDLLALKELGMKSKNDYTTDQLMYENLKNKDGESNLEVRKRMTDAIMEILDNFQGKKIAVVSHGAAIKYYLQNFCEYDKENETLVYNGEAVCSRKLESPSLIKIVFKGKTVVSFEGVIKKRITEIIFLNS